ncbi:MAG: DUF222 domain-containing protein, partial [Actinomycetota bacterium]
MDASALLEERGPEPDGSAPIEVIPTSDLVASLDRLHAEISARQREQLRIAAELDRRRRFERDGCRDMAQWLAGRYDTSWWRASRMLHAGHALEHLPLVSESFASGTLGLDKVVELARFATSESEHKLIAWARRVMPAAIRRRADRADRHDLDDAQEAERTRSLRWWWFDEGRRLGLEGEFPAAQGAAITQALRRVADTLPADVPDDGAVEVESTPADTLDQRCADALYALAATSIASDQDPDRATVVVRTSLDSIYGRFGELERGPVLHPETARRLGCDARLQFVLTDKQGDALGIGHTSRNVPAWLHRELLFRDDGCTFPGCGTRAFLQAHHIRHWEDLGPTELWNLVLVCFFHHKLVHELGWKVVLNGTTTEWYRPNGSRYEPGPDPPSLSSVHEQLDLAPMPRSDLALLI